MYIWVCFEVLQVLTGGVYQIVMIAETYIKGVESTMFSTMEVMKISTTPVINMVFITADEAVGVEG